MPNPLGFLHCLLTTNQPFSDQIRIHHLSEELRNFVQAMSFVNFLLPYCEKGRTLRCFLVHAMSYATLSCVDEKAMMLFPDNRSRSKVGKSE